MRAGLGVAGCAVFAVFSVFADTAAAFAEGDAPRFEGFVAPGRHVVSIRLEAQAKDDDRFVTTTEDTFTVDAPQKKLLILKASAEDGGDIAYAWKKKQKGSYKLRLDVSAQAKDLVGGDAAAPAALPPKAKPDKKAAPAPEKPAEKTK